MRHCLLTIVLFCGHLTVFSQHIDLCKIDKTNGNVASVGIPNGMKIQQALLGLSKEHFSILTVELLALFTKDQILLKRRS